MLELTDNEKAVLYGLVRYPEANDLELSERLEVKRPTVTAIRNRLERQKAYTTKRIPDLNKLGCELITATSTQYNALTPYEARKKTRREDQTTFLEIQTDGQELTLSAAKNFTQAKRQMEEHLVYGVKNDYFSVDDTKSITFPLSMSKMFLLFDYAPLLQRHFMLEPVDRIVCDPKLTQVQPYEFTENERRVYCTLIERPDIRETKIAEMFSISRTTVRSIYERMHKNALLKTIRIPDVRKLGLELMVFTHISVNSDRPLESRKANLERVLNSRSHTLMLSSDMESIAISFFKNYGDYQTSSMKLLEYGRKEGFLAEEPRTLIFPTEDIRFFREASFEKLVNAFAGVQ